VQLSEYNENAKKNILTAGSYGQQTSPFKVSPQSGQRNSAMSGGFCSRPPPADSIRKGCL